FYWRKLTRAGRQLFCVIYFLACCGAMQAAAARPRQAPAYKRGMKFVTDETGRRMAIPFSVQHIVTLAPDLTETVYALGMEDKLVGDTSFCDTPPAAKLKPHVGAPQTPTREGMWRVIRTWCWRQLRSTARRPRTRCCGWVFPFTPAIRIRCAGCWIPSRAWLI